MQNEGSLSTPLSTSLSTPLSTCSVDSPVDAGRCPVDGGLPQSSQSGQSELRELARENSVRHALWHSQRGSTPTSTKFQVPDHIEAWQLGLLLNYHFERCGKRGSLDAKASSFRAISSRHLPIRLMVPFKIKKMKLKISRRKNPKSVSGDCSLLPRLKVSALTEAGVARVALPGKWVRGSGGEVEGANGTRGYSAT